MDSEISSYYRSPNQRFPYSVAPNKTLLNHCLGTIDSWRFYSLSIESMGTFYSVMCWSFYWASGINHYQDHPHKSPRSVIEWAKLLRIPKKKMGKIFFELQESELVRIDVAGNVLLREFHYQEEEK